MTKPIPVRFNDDALQQEAYERLETLLDKTKGSNGIRGMGTLLRAIAMTYLPMAENDFIPKMSADSKNTTGQDAYREYTGDSTQFDGINEYDDGVPLLTMPEDWE